MKKAYLHLAIQKKILDRILGGMYGPGDKVPGTQDLVREFGTSSVTIDKALSGLVEQGYMTRKARKGSYITPRDEWPSTPGEAGASPFYGIVMRDSSAPYFWKNTARGIHDGVRSYDYGILFGYIDENLDAAVAYIDSLYRKKVRGIIFAPISMPTEKDYEEFNSVLIDYITERDIPLVLIDRRLKSREASSITSKDYQAAIELTGRLLDSGVKNPVCFTHLFNSAFEARITGFCDALRERGFKNPENRVFDPAPGTNLLDSANREDIDKIFSSLPSFDGVFTVNAANLFACVNAIGRNQEAFPGKIRYANFDDIGFLSIDGLTASAVQQSHHIGFLAVHLLEEMILPNNESTFSVVENFLYREYRDTR